MRAEFYSSNAKHLRCITANALTMFSTYATYKVQDQASALHNLYIFYIYMQASYKML